METAALLELVQHVDRVGRRNCACRTGLQIVELPRGWLCARPGAPPSEFPSSSLERVHWVNSTEPLSPQDAGAFVEVARSLACRRLYIWMVPWLWTPPIEEALAKLGAVRWPYVEYITLTRSPADLAPLQPTALQVRVTPPDEARRFMPGWISWYGTAMVALALAEQGFAEIHVAYDGQTPIAAGVACMDGEYAYLGAAAASPEHRGRGAQSALIRSRLRRAGELGARTCVSETNTAVPTSLRNLERYGFRPVINWRVYRWDDPRLVGA